MPRNTNITLRKGTATEWTTVNPILDNGEPGYDTTNQKLKIGNGSTAWSGLPYEGSVSPIFTGVVTVPQGSAFAPSITFNNDINNGIFSPASNTVAVSTGGFERFRITSVGRVLVGTSTSRTAGPADHPYFQLEGTVTAGTGSIQQIVGSTTAAVSPQILLARHRGSIGESTLVAANDSLGIIRFNGGDGSDVSSTGAQIECFVDGTPGNNDMPGRLIFSTAADGAASPTERMRIDSSGNIGIASSSPSHKLDVTGTIRTRTGGIGHQDNGCYVAYPGGGSLKNTGAVQTGYIKITLPVSWTNTMLQFGVDIFEYSAQKNKTFRIAGYNHIASSTWIGESAFMDSDNDFLKYRIHFGHDGTKCAIYISKLDSSGADLGAATTWDYVQIAVKDIFASFSADSLTWADGWAISITTTIGTLSGSIEVSRPYRQHDTSYVFNEYGGNVDFRIEGDTDTNLFFVDSSVDNIGIGTSEPLAKLEISTTQTSIVRFDGLPVIGPPSASDYQTLILKQQSGSLILEHHENITNGSSALTLKNLIRYGSDFISIDNAYISSLGFTYNPKFRVNTTTGAITFNNVYTFPTSDGTSGQVLTTNGSGTISWSTPTSASSSIDISICNGRLTLISGNSLGYNTTNNSVYFTPYNGNRIALYNGSSWSLHTFSELSITAGSSGSNTNWDVFIYNNSGTLTLERVQWTNDSTRATSLTLQDGIYVMSGSPTKRYLGTFRTNETLGPMSQTEDSEYRRLVWNLYNQIYKPLSGGILNQQHTYANTTVYRAWNNNTTIGEGRFNFVLGLPSGIHAGFWVNHLGGAITALGLDANNNGAINTLLTAVNSDITYGFRSIQFVMTDRINEGYHFLQLQQLGSATPATFSNIQLWSQIPC